MGRGEGERKNTGKNSFDKQLPGLLRDWKDKQKNMPDLWRREGLMPRNPRPTKKVVTVRLTAEQRELLRRLSIAQGISEGAVVGKALEAQAANNTDTPAPEREGKEG